MQKYFLNYKYLVDFTMCIRMTGKDVIVVDDYNINHVENLMFVVDKFAVMHEENFKRKNYSVSNLVIYSGKLSIFDTMYSFFCIVMHAAKANNLNIMNIYKRIVKRNFYKSIMSSAYTNIMFFISGYEYSIYEVKNLTNISFYALASLNTGYIFKYRDMLRSVVMSDSTGYNLTFFKKAYDFTLKH